MLLQCTDIYMFVLPLVKPKKSIHSVKRHAQNVVFAAYHLDNCHVEQIFSLDLKALICLFLYFRDPCVAVAPNDRIHGCTVALRAALARATATPISSLAAAS